MKILQTSASGNANEKRQPTQLGILHTGAGNNGLIAKKQRKQFAALMLASGHPHAEIAERCSVTRQTVYNWEKEPRVRQMIADCMDEEEGAAYRQNMMLDLASQRLAGVLTAIAAERGLIIKKAKIKKIATRNMRGLGWLHMSMVATGALSDETLRKVAEDCQLLPAGAHAFALRAAQKEIATQKDGPADYSLLGDQGAAV